MAFLEKISKIARSLLGTTNEARLKQYSPVINGANSIELDFASYDDKKLRTIVEELRERAINDSEANEFKSRAFALVREVADRRLGMWNAISNAKSSFDEKLWGACLSEVEKIRSELKAGAEPWSLDVSAKTYAVVRDAHPKSIPPFRMRAHDVQMIGALVLNDGCIAEMKTGEGKTLVASFASYINAIVGRSVHVITVNDYLAARDAKWNEPTLRFLDISVGAIQSEMDHSQRQKIYAQDITYGTNNEFGFDYLRDNLKQHKEEQVQTRKHFAIVDEVDSVLIDEARTPLIISGPTPSKKEFYQIADTVAKKLEIDKDFEVDIKDRNVTMTDDGLVRAAEFFGVPSLFEADTMHLPHFLDNALKAHHLFHKDKEYLVHGNSIAIVDEFTGRIMSGRRWSDGLHQAIETKESVPVEDETQTYATITLQNFFRMYGKLAGMTGTALTEAQEFHDIYKLETLAIPTNLPVIRRDMQDLIFGTTEEKYNAIADEIKTIHAFGQPVLVGTVSVESSEDLSKKLKKRGIKHNVLNARQHKKEADIIKNAGTLGAVTIATNMAGRGTDIVLGNATPKVLLKHWASNGLAPKKKKIEDAELEEAIVDIWSNKFLNEKTLEKMKDSSNEEKLSAINKELKLQGWAELEAPLSFVKEGVDVRQLGGLRIIGTERHESRRIDNQLRGRSGRQGDRGASRFYLSLEDDLMKRFAGPTMSNLMRSMGLKDGEAIESGMVSRAVEKAQKRVEEYHQGARKNLLEYDEVMNLQRTQVYSHRQRILEGDNLEEFLLEFYSKAVDDFIQHSAEGGVRGDELAEAISNGIHELNGLPKLSVSEIPVKEGGDACCEFVMKSVKEALKVFAADAGESYDQVLRFVLLETIDRYWKDHLYNMDHLRHSIGLESYGQKDPKLRYKEEGFRMFMQMSELIRHEIAKIMFRIQVRDEDEAGEREERLDDAFQAGGFTPTGPEAHELGPEGPMRQPAPNDPCPCGSGSLYRECHGLF